MQFYEEHLRFAMTEEQSHQVCPTISVAYAPLAVSRQLSQGKSLIRSLFNLALQSHTVGGRVLDLGSKDGAGSYYQYLKVGPESEITYTDLENGEGVVSVDVEKSFPFPESSFDVVLAFHLFEHVYKYEVAPKEIFRLLPKGGKVFLSVPFMHEYHADPEDYFRFTDTAIRRIWEAAGFHCVHLEAIGEGLFTAFATKIPGVAFPRAMRPWARAIFYMLAMPLDRIINRYRPLVNGKNVAQRFALEHFAIFEK